MSNRSNGRTDMTAFRRTAAILAALLLCAQVMLSGCSKSGAVDQVRADLDSMRTAQINRDAYNELVSILSDDGRECLYEFLHKVEDFEYEIIGTEKRSAEEGGGVVVKVRIRTYKFGMAYLKTWTDYIEENSKGSTDETAFYEALVRNLSEVDTKDYYADVDIICVDPDGTGEWKTDAKSNSRLRDALFGGMLTEIAVIAGIE